MDYQPTVTLEDRLLKKIGELTVLLDMSNEELLHYKNLAQQNPSDSDSELDEDPNAL